MSRPSAIAKAVRNDSLKVAGAAFYQPGEMDIMNGLRLRVNTACLALIRADAVFDGFSGSLTKGPKSEMGLGGGGALDGGRLEQIRLSALRKP